MCVAEGHLSIGSVYSQLFPGVSVDAHSFHASLTDVFVAKLCAAFSPLASCQFTAEDVLGNTAVFHKAHMAQPAQTALPEDGVHAG